MCTSVPIYVKKNTELIRRTITILAWLHGCLKRWLCLPNKVVIFVIFSPCVSQTPVVSYCSKHVVQSFADIKIFRFSSFSPLSDYYQFQYVGRWQSFPISSLLKHTFCLRSDDTFELMPEKNSNKWTF